MMRERFRKRVGAAALAGLGLSSLAGSSAAAAELLTFDLRLPGGGKVATAPTVGNSITLEVWAQVQNGDGNHANDGFTTGQFGIYSTEPGAGSIQGDLAPMTFVAPFANPDPQAFVSQPGTAQNLDSTAADKELGGTDVNDSGSVFAGNMWVVATGNNGSAMATIMGSGSGSGVTEFKLGTTTWTVGANGTLDTTLNVGIRKNTVTYLQPFDFVSDGTAYHIRWDGLTQAQTTLPVTVGNSTVPVTLTAGGPLSAIWTGASTANWGVGTNWSGGTAPNVAGDTANFGTGGSPVNVEGAHSVGTMNFSSAGHTISGPGTITLDAATGSAAVNVTSGSHLVSAPVTLADHTAVSVAGGSAITFGSLTSTGFNITKTGTGSLVVNAVRNSAALDVQAGTVAITASGNTNANTSKVNSLTINTGAGAKLDIGDSDLIVDYTGGSTAGNIRTLLQSAYNSGAWNNAGIGTTASLAGGLSIGYAEASSVVGAGGGTFSGQSTDGSAVLVKFTYAGDANLDGKVDIGDLGLLAGAWQQASGKVWFDGDFTYDGAVDIGDLGLLAGNWQKGTAGNPNAPQTDFNTALAQFSAFEGVAVPEPVSLSLLALGGLVLGVRRRK